MKKYVYINSYATFKIALHLKKIGETVCIINGLPKFKEVSEAAGFQTMQVSSPPRIANFKQWNIINTVKEIYFYLKSINIELDNILSFVEQNSEIYISCAGIDLVGMYWMWHMPKGHNIKIIYYDLDGEIHTKIKINGVIQILRLYFLRLLYRLPITWEHTPSGDFYFLDKDEVEKKFTVVFAKNILHKKLYEGIQFKNNLPKLEILILGCYSFQMTSHMYNIEDLKNIYTFIFENTKKVYYKPHPGVTDLEDFFQNYNICPEYYPVEMIANKIDLVLGDTSTGMINLANLGVKCVSFIDMIRVEESFDWKYWKNRMSEDTQGKITYVKSFDELGVLLNTLK